MSIYASVNANGLGGPAAEPEPDRCLVDVAVGVDLTRLGLLDPSGGFEWYAYLTAEQAVEVAIALLHASRSVGYVAGLVLGE